MMLSGCLGSETEVDLDTSDIAALVIPELSESDRRRCYDPGIRAGTDARSIIADHRVALSDCRQKHARVVQQYDAIPDIINPPSDEQNGDP